MKKLSLDDIDDSLLQELIDQCEAHMSSGFKDKAKAKAEAEMPEEGSEEEEQSESPDEESNESEIDPEMLKKLMDNYKNRK